MSVHSTVYFDITIGGEAAGRITMELSDVTPKASENFRARSRNGATSADVVIESCGEVER